MAKHNSVLTEFETWWELEVCGGADPYLGRPKSVRECGLLVKELCQLAWQEGRACGILDGQTPEWEDN